MKIIILFLILILLSSCNNEMSISACPTMHNLLGSNDINVVESSNHGFMAVKAERHDFVVTGRPPSPNDNNGLKTIMIREGYTIVSHSNANIFLSELKNIKVSNCAGIMGTKNFIMLPCDTYPTSNNLKLVSWNDWKGEPFVTVYDDTTRLKSMEFRGVYLTGREDDKRISKAANKIYDMI